MEDFFKYIKQSFELKNQKLYKEAIEVLYKVLSDDVDTKTMVEVMSQIADLHLLLKNKERAIEQYEGVLEIDSSHEHSKNKLYEIYFEQREFKKALSIAEKICENSIKPMDYVKYFNALIKTGETNRVFEKYETLSDELKNDSNILYIISLLKEEGKKEILENIVSKSPGFCEAKFDLAMIYYNDEKYLEAEKLFDDILKIKKDPLSYYYKALIQIDRLEYFPAIDNLHMAIKASKGAVSEFYFELAKAYMDVNWFDEAISTIKSSITLCIEKGEDKLAIDKRYLLLAWVFEKQKDYDNALFNLTPIGENSPIRLQADILRAVIDFKTGNIIQAKEQLEKLYNENVSVRDDLTLLDTLGAIYKDLKLNNKASEFYEKHLMHYPNSTHTVCEYVDLLIDVEKYDKAISLIEKYSLNGKNLSFLNSLARIHYRKQEYNLAIECLEKLLDYDKNNAEAYYFKSLILNDTKDYNSAINLVKTALELNPVPAKYYALGAKINYNLGFYSEAMMYIKEAIEIEPNDLNYKKFASEIAAKDGKEHEAGFWMSIVNSTESVIKDRKRM